jgi:hypothetical protein
MKTLYCAILIYNSGNRTEGVISLMKRCMPFVVLTILVAALMSACSGTRSAISPDISKPGLSDVQGQSVLTRNMIGFWELTVDYSGISAIEISERAAATHMNVKKFLKPPNCSDCIKFSNVTNNTTDKIFQADVTVKNSTAYSGADIRGIVMSNNPAVFLSNPDDYTTLYDKHTPPNINPFRLFGKELPNGTVGPSIEVTEHFEIKYDAMPFIVQSAVDAIYPISANREPYIIKNQAIGGDLDTNGSVSRMVECTILDRNKDTGTVSVSSEELGVNIKLDLDPDQANHYIGWLSNTEKKPAGEYKLLISAADSVVPQVLYDYLTVNVAASVGHWEVKSFPFDTSCSRDISAGVNATTGEPMLFLSGGGSCQLISKTTFDFTAPTNFFNLNDIDQLNAGFSPFPIKRLDSSYSGGVAFCTSSDATYSDPFYTGPVASLLVTVFPNASGTPSYINPGDGDAGRMYPSNPGLVVVDISDDLSASIFALWADPEGVIPPELYGLSPDFTRHDVFMGGAFPSTLIGTGSGKISASASKLKAIDVASFGGAGTIYILESAGSDTEVEVFQYAVDFQTKKTTFLTSHTITMPGIKAVDLDVASTNPLYAKNPDKESLAVLVDGPSGGYIKMYNLGTFDFIEDIGSASEPSITGTAAYLDIENTQWKMVITNSDDLAYTVSWVL